MAVIYMRHPTHGTMVFSTDLEASVAQGAGWERFDPEAHRPAVPSFLTPSAGTPLPNGFPGREALVEAGLSTLESITGKTSEELQSIKGVGERLAHRILDAQ